MSVEKPPAILLGGAETAVPVCRGLGRAGIPVIAIGGSADPVRYSRYCTRYVDLGDGPDSQVRWLEHLLSDSPPGVLIPGSDHGVEMIARNRAALVERGHVPPEGSDEALLAMLDKGLSYEIAARAGVATPQSAVLHEPGDVESRLDGLAFPCGIKPLEGHRFRERTGRLDKVIVVDDRDHFARLARPWLSDGIGLLATELIAGPVDRLYSLFTYMDPAGEPLFQLTARKLRQEPADFGVASYIKEEDEPRVAEAGLRFLRGAGLAGMAQVEFKHDERDDSFKLIECNPRFALPIELLIASGLDLPPFVYARQLGRPTAELRVERRGVRLWHPVPDFRSLRQQRELTWGRWARSLLHRQRFTLFAADDPRPSLVVNGRLVTRFVANRLGRRGRAKGG